MATSLQNLIGCRVHSKRVGDRKPFTGVITDVWLHIDKKVPNFYFHVKDANGAEWHRTFSEIDWPSSGELEART